mmetsp:Transcript_114105/g.322673  ORF Transcript_114105/g.322673 Transcript_114105/m.322673 type:complete len:263 (+) Transcript_114105:38-826(+)
MFCLCISMVATSQSPGAPMVTSTRNPARHPLPGLSRALQEGSEIRAGEYGFRLLQCLDFLVAGGLPEFEVFHHEVAARMQLRVVVGELLQLKHHRLLALFRLHEDHLRLRLRLRLVDDVLVLRLHGSVCILHEILVGFLGILFRADGLGLHGLRVADDLLEQAHDATRRGALLVGLEARRWRRPCGLLPLRQGCARVAFAVDFREDADSRLQELLCFALVGHGGLEFLVLLLAILARALELHLHLRDFRLERINRFTERIDC